MAWEIRLTRLQGISKNLQNAGINRLALLNQLNPLILWRTNLAELHQITAEALHQLVHIHLSEPRSSIFLLCLTLLLANDFRVREERRQVARWRRRREGGCAWSRRSSSLVFAFVLELRY